MILSAICSSLVLLTCVICENVRKPNIVFIMADDLGWDDVSFHGSDQIMTPNIDVLAYQGQILQEYYSDTQGTAARSALFTGKYPMRLGTQGDSILGSEDRGIPITEKLLPSYLRELGYDTHLVGKWHVGKSREHYLPTYRGFDTFYGFLDGSVDYYTYNLVEDCNGTSLFGLNLFEDLEPVENQTGHLTDILTDRAIKLIRKHNVSRPLYLHISHAAPHAGGGLVNLQPPVETIAENKHIAHSARRLYAGLVTSLDKSIGAIVSALAEREILKNTMIIIVSDNGAAPIGSSQNFGCNLPLRGVKSTPWEGASRAIAIFWHSKILPDLNKEMMHVTDWFPTLISAAGGKPPKDIDGVDQWNMLSNDEKTTRTNVLIAIDDLNGWAAYRDGNFKIIVGNVSKDKSKYHGKELRIMNHKTRSYEKALLESETHFVLKETLGRNLDVDEALQKRNESFWSKHADKITEDDICIPTLAKGCLYNISEDPIEAYDLWHAKVDVVRHMTLRLRSLWMEMSPRYKTKMDPRANPAITNFVWLPWIPNDEENKEPLKIIPPFPLRVSREELQYLVDRNLNSFQDQLREYITNMGESFVRNIGGLFNF